MVTFDLGFDLSVQVILCKFHSVFLTKGGRVLTCGHGTGGRLGHDSELSIVVGYVCVECDMTLSSALW